MEEGNFKRMEFGLTEFYFLLSYLLVSPPILHILWIEQFKLTNVRPVICCFGYVLNIQTSQISFLKAFSLNYFIFKSI